MKMIIYIHDNMNLSKMLEKILNLLVISLLILQPSNEFRRETEMLVAKKRLRQFLNYFRFLVLFMF